MPKASDFRQLFLISGLVCAATSEPVVCPDSSQWSLRTRAFCNSTHPSLNCLYEETTSTFVQFCTTRPDFQRPGYKFIIRGNIDGIVCEKNRFQPIKFWTNGSSDCILEKTRCDEHGQVIHVESDSTSDRTCRCDYTKGFAFVSQRQNCFCDPSLEDCSCFLKPCSKFQVMTPDYNCINAKDWTGLFKCPVITKTMTTSATTRCPTTTPDMNRSPLMSMVVKKFNALTVTVLIVTTVMLIIVSTTCGTNIKKCCRNLNMTEKELDERYERIKKDELKGNLNMTETELDERSELMRKENIKDRKSNAQRTAKIFRNIKQSKARIDKICVGLITIQAEQKEAMHINNEQMEAISQQRQQSKDRIYQKASGNCGNCLAELMSSTPLQKQLAVSGFYQVSPMLNAVPTYGIIPAESMANPTYITPIMTTSSAPGALTCFP
ncbi:uncharacterized protein [Mytilus edulis]|uniref:uncharacterized protein n=1 Tax=Mytilus edulis TaxID=6550 RepID=UPI0039F0AF9A